MLPLVPMASRHPAHPLWPAALVVALCAACVRNAGAAPHDARFAAAVQREIDRLDAKVGILAAASRPSPPPPELERFRSGLQRARTAAAPSLRLVRLRDVCVDVERFAYAGVHRQAGESAAAFETLWSEEAPRFAPSPTMRRSGGGLLIALGDAAQNRAEKLYAASRAYARVTSPEAGLYYLGEAHGQLQFRDLVRALGTPAPSTAEPPPDAQRLDMAADATERAVLAAFAGDRMNPALVPVSTSLKEARELAARGAPEAAALVLFQTRLLLPANAEGGERAAGTVASAAEPVPPARLDAADDSLLALLHAIATDPTVPESIRRAATRDALPLYATLFRRP
jgi:hypothetical protein